MHRDVTECYIPGHLISRGHNKQPKYSIEDTDGKRSKYLTVFQE